MTIELSVHLQKKIIKSKNWSDFINSNFLFFFETIQIEFLIIYVLKINKILNIVLKI